ncbi:MFS transporter [Litorihabitans aurantiacus]|uniref:MFS transporter n=1 Tax=Litorihabitans aurantiacus TaxID=1930061 RepID=A0AA37XD28_9MICO|nr:MFS transporter [Litorihabitans aurantiacus]GMA30931.1 MFS transporter [Litorihabitans aurantiacus]
MTLREHAGPDVPGVSDDLRRRRFALFALFFVPGVGISSWVTRTPAIRDALEASTAQMGLVLFGLSVGSMIGILASGPLVARLGTRPVIVTGSLSVVVSMLVIGFGALGGLAGVVAVGLALFGLGMGGGEVALNVEGADVERGIGRPVLPAMHGCFSLGTVVGASLGIALTAGQVSVVGHLVGISVLTLTMFLLVIGRLGPGLAPARERAGADSSGAGPDAAAHRPVWRDPTLLLIGAIVLAMAFAEGAANDWLPLVMVDGHGFAPAWGSAVYALFAAAMTVGRFCGSWVLDRVSRVNVVRLSALAGGIGLALVVFVDSQPVAAAAVVLWGLGASLGFPLALSAAGDSGENPAGRVALVATLGYVAFLIGPPILGFVGEEHGLRGALVVVLSLVVVAGLLAPAVRPRDAVAR